MAKTKTKTTRREVKKAAPESDTVRARAAVEKWWAFSEAVLGELAHAGRRLEGEVIRKGSPIYAAMPSWALVEFVDGIEDAMCSLTNCRLRPPRKLVHTPDPLAGIG
jgi:hypothetical protein